MTKTILISIVSSLFAIGIGAAFIFPSETIDKWMNTNEESTNNLNPADNPNEIVVATYEPNTDSHVNNSQSEFINKEHGTMVQDTIKTSILSDDVPSNYK